MNHFKYFKVGSLSLSAICFALFTFLTIDIDLSDKKIPEQKSENESEELEKEVVIENSENIKETPLAESVEQININEDCEGLINAYENQLALNSHDISPSLVQNYYNCMVFGKPNPKVNGSKEKQKESNTVKIPEPKLQEPVGKKKK